MDWTMRCYSRMLIDNHISEHDPSLMARFDPKVYADMVEKAGLEASMIYACCHNGNCYYPTKVGHMHANLKGRDIFGETVAEVAKRGIVPIAYTTVIYHNDSAQNHPDWRMNIFGRNHRQGRYWYSCPNNPDYAEFCKAQTAEILAYPVEGIFIDMVFWPGICLCPNCRTAYLAETGCEIPEKIDWSDPAWVQFQRARERWMGDFTRKLYQHCKSVRPDATVTQQFSPVLLGWTYGQSPAIAASCDYTSGDFYGGKYQHVLGAKILSAFTKNQPFEFMTSRCVNLYDHTSMKSTEEMLCEVSLTIANGGAPFFIDAINPDGTLCGDVFVRIGEVNTAAKPFTDKLRDNQPVLAGDVGLYYSMPSHVDPKDSGITITDTGGPISNMSLSGNSPAITELIGTSRALSRARLLYRMVVSSKPSPGVSGSERSGDPETKTGPDLSNLSTLIINNAAYMSSEEVEAVREFVKNGGTLIATGMTSLYDLVGSTTGDFALADVFGVSYSRQRTDGISYLAYEGEIDKAPVVSTPLDQRAPFVERSRNEHVSGQQYVASTLPAPLVNATSAEVLAKVSAPLFPTNDPNCYASIHSNPPGRITDHAGLTVNSFGRGKCIYIYSGFLAQTSHAQQEFGASLFGQFARSRYQLKTNAPQSVEVTLLDSTVDATRLLCLVNYQTELPNVPVDGIEVEIRLPLDRAPQTVVCSSDKSPVEFSWKDGLLKLTLDRLETMEMVEISQQV